MNGVFAERVLDANDVCRNCFARNRVERVDPTRGGLGGQLDSHYSRHEERTEIGYGPADAVSDQKGVFCQCGVEGAHERVWDAAGYARYKGFVAAAVTALEEKGVDVRRQTAVAVALQGFRDAVDGRLLPVVESATVDRLLSTAVSAGVAAASASSQTSRRRAD